MSHEGINVLSSSFWIHKNAKTTTSAFKSDTNNEPFLLTFCTTNGWNAFTYKFCGWHYCHYFGWNYCFTLWRSVYFILSTLDYQKKITYILGGIFCLYGNKNLVEVDTRLEKGYKLSELLPSFHSNCSVNKMMWKWSCKKAIH